MQRELRQGHPVARLADSDQPKGEYREQRQDEAMQRPDPRESSPQERPRLRTAAFAQTLAIIEPQHEPRQHEEQIDCQIAFRERIDHRVRHDGLQRITDVVEHHEPRRDAAYAGQCVKTGERRSAHA